MVNIYSLAGTTNFNILGDNVKEWLNQHMYFIVKQRGNNEIQLCDIDAFLFDDDDYKDYIIINYVTDITSYDDGYTKRLICKARGNVELKFYIAGSIDRSWKYI